MRKFLLSIIAVGILMLSACSTNENPVEPTGQGATMKLTVTAGERYYIKFSEKSEVTIADYLMEDEWDIVIDNLTRIRVNGGATAPGKVHVLMLDGTDYDKLAKAPDLEYVTDTQDSYAIGEAWYFYNVNDHTVNPLDKIYVIKTADGAFYKFMITECVFSSRTDGEIKFRFDPVDAPAKPEYQDTHARVRYVKFSLSGAEKTYLNLKEGTEVAIGDQATSTVWDLYSDFVTIYTNGGTSGPGQGAGILYEATEFDSVNSAPQEGYVADDTLASPESKWAVGDSWFSYDFNTHSLSVNADYTYVLRTADGRYAKLEFVAAEFYGQSGGMAVMRIEYLDYGTEF